MKSIRKIVPFVVMMTCAICSNAQNYYTNGKQWVDKSEQLKPELITTVVEPVGIVNIVKDATAFQGWKAEKVANIDSLYNTPFQRIQSIVIDLGDHYTGYFSFDLKNFRSPDAPVRFRFTFGEVPAEIVTPYDDAKCGISRAWLQDMEYNIMPKNIPGSFTIERRMACRYIKIDLIGNSPYFDVVFNNIKMNAVSSAGDFPEELSAQTPDMIKKIDKIGLKTLKECMQTVYEDGPKRDRRLWVGDMYLESMANTVSFENHQLTKRCLYMLAGLSDDNGYVLGTVFEEPNPHPQAGQLLMDYSLLYNVSLKNYLLATNDKETAEELWPVAKRQLNIINEYVDENGLIDYERADDEWWLFFDWKDGLNKNAAIQGLMIFALNETYDLAELLGKTEEVKDIPSLIKKMKKAAITNMYNKKTGLFESGTNHQLSYASQIWMILGGVLNEKQSQKALNTVMSTTEALYPGGPYMYHYLIQALINSGMEQQAKEMLVKYWGNMVDKGADTFWEVYDPSNDYLSPYGFFPINSYCHAWSCTPVYFIRKYPEIFQQ